MPRKEKKYHFIYKTTNNLSGKYYLGMHSTDNLDDGYLGSGKRLRYSINKYGKDNHSREILEFLDSRKELKKREEEIVNLNEIAKAECLNLKVGGEGGFVNEDHRNKFIESLKIGHNKNWKINFNHHEKLKSDSEYKERYCRIMKKTNNSGVSGFNNKNHSEESKNKMRNTMRLNKHQTGSNNSQFGTCWIYNDTVSKKIKKVDLDSYLKLGWIKGRKIKS